MGDTRARRMLVHTYRDDIWIMTEEFASENETMKILRSRGWKFRSKGFSGLGDGSLTFQNGNLYAEIEESIEDDGSVSFQEKDYIPVKEWAEKHGMSVRKARYAYRKGNLKGMTIGNRNYLYIRRDEDGKR